MAVTYNPCNIVPAYDGDIVSLTSQDIDEILTQLKSESDIDPGLIDELIQFNKEMADFTDSISGKQAFYLLKRYLEKN